MRRQISLLILMLILALLGAAEPGNASQLTSGGSTTSGLSESDPASAVDSGAEQPSTADLVQGVERGAASAVTSEPLLPAVEWTRFEDSGERSQQRPAAEVAHNLFGHSLQVRHVRLQI